MFKSGFQNDFELLRILYYWSLNYRGSGLPHVPNNFKNNLEFTDSVGNLHLIIKNFQTIVT